MTLALQHTARSWHPVLLRVDTKANHGALAIRPFQDFERACSELLQKWRKAGSKASAHNAIAVSLALAIPGCDDFAIRTQSNRWVLLLLSGIGVELCAFAKLVSCGAV